MRSHYRVVVIGGGIVGASVLYHLAKLGCSDAVLIERRELTAGSTWHAAAGFHAINADPTIAALQSYTIGLYRDLALETEHDLGLHITGAITFAGTQARWEWLQSALSLFKGMGLAETGLISPAEIRERCPIVDVGGLYGGLWDPNDGYLDPYGTTHAFAAAARKRGAEIVLRNRVLELHPTGDGHWQVVTEAGTIMAEHVVNAAGLWAKQVGMMAGVDLPVVPMEHHYLVTERIPELGEREIPSLVDLEGFTYARQEGQGMLLGVYERNPKHWQVEGAPWDYGMELIPEDVERIAPELTKGFERYPVLNDVGVKRWVNGAFTFTPDGNPLIGPVPGLRNYWCACGVMAGFSQGGGVGLSLAQWIIDGEPSNDVFGMDVARYGAFASSRAYLKATTGQFYARRFLLTYPNEQLPAGRPLKVPPAHRQMTEQGAAWGCSWGMEVPLYFAPPDRPFVETPSLKRSDAFPFVAAECRAAREAVALLDTTAFSRFEVSGRNAAGFLDRLLACRLPSPGRIRLAPMLGPSGRLMGDLTVSAWPDGTFWLMGSYYLRAWHLRWLMGQMTADDVAIRDLSDATVGLAVIGPASRELLGRITDADLSNTAFPFMTCREVDVGLVRAKVGRLSVAGELGYEINLASSELPALYQCLLDAGRDLGIRPIGYGALNSLRLEKSFGIWSREFTSAYTPAMSGLDRFIAYDKPGFIGRDAAVAERELGSVARRLVTLEVDATDADAGGFEPVWQADRLVGQVTSGGFGHTCNKSLAMAYLDSAVVADAPSLAVDVVGVRRAARIIPASPVDPAGLRMRS